MAVYSRPFVSGIAAGESGRPDVQQHRRRSDGNQQGGARRQAPVAPVARKIAVLLGRYRTSSATRSMRTSCRIGGSPITSISLATMDPAELRGSRAPQSPPNASAIEGNNRLKRVLFLSAFAAIRFDPASRAYFDRKRAKGKRHNQALIALAHRRLAVLFAMIRDGSLDNAPLVNAA